MVRSPLLCAELNHVGMLQGTLLLPAQAQPQARVHLLRHSPRLALKRSSLAASTSTTATAAAAVPARIPFLPLSKIRFSQLQRTRCNFRSAMRAQARLSRFSSLRQNSSAKATPTMTTARTVRFACRSPHNPAPANSSLPLHLLAPAATRRLVVTPPVSQTTSKCPTHLHPLTTACRFARTYRSRHERAIEPRFLCVTVTQPPDLLPSAPIPPPERQLSSFFC